MVGHSWPLQVPERLGELFSTGDIIFKARIKIQEDKLISQEKIK